MLSEEQSSLRKLKNNSPRTHPFSDFALRLSLKYVVQYLARLEQASLLEENERHSLAEEASLFIRKAKGRKLAALGFFLLGLLPLVAGAALLAWYLLGNEVPPGWSLFIIFPALTVTCFALALTMLWRSRISRLRADIIFSSASKISENRFQAAKEELRPWIEEGYILEDPISIGKK